MTPADALLASLVFGAGCCLQASLGFGANLVAAPLLVLLADGFVPGPVVVASGLLNLLVLRRNPPAHVDPTVRVAIGGQVAGTLVAGLVLARLSVDALSLLFAGLVLLAVALSVLGLHLARTNPNLAGAGVASGFMGTISGIGGPPIALAYSDLPTPQLRATLARYFLAGNVIAVPTLIVAGALTWDHLPECLALVPGTVLGVALSPFLARHLDRRTARPFVLVLSALAAVAVLVRTLA